MELDGYLSALGQLPSYDQLRMNALAIQQARLSNTGQDLQNQFQQRRIAAADAEAAETEQFKADLQSLGDAPSPEAYWRLAAKHPTLKGIGDAATALTDAQRRQTVGRAGQIHAALQNNRPDLAATLVQQSLDAARNSGQQPDPDDVALLAAINSKDPEQIRAVKGGLYAIIAASNPDTAARNVGEYGGDASDKRYTVGRALIDPSGKVIYRDPEPKYQTVKNADGSESIVQLSGGGDPVSSGGSGATGGTGQPRSVRNNNRGNIRYGAFAKSQGATGSDDAGYAIFPSPEAGVAAQAALLGGKGYFGGGRRTVASIIEKWAPRSSKGGDNTDAQVDNYIKYVARKLNVNPNDALTPAVLPRMAEAMGEFEGGATGRSGTTRAGGAPSAAPAGPRVVFTSQPAAANPVDRATVEFYANKIAAGGDLPQLGSGKESSAWRRAILSRAAEIQNGRGISGGDSNLAQADVKANRSALLQAQKQYTSTVGFEQTFQANVKEVLRLAPSGVGGSAPIFNRWIQAGRKNVQGDPAVSAFNVAVNTAANEYAKLASGASGGAVTSDSARHEAMEILNNAQTLPQLQASIRQMQIDGHNRVVALDDQIKRLRGNIRNAGGGGASGNGTPTPAAAPRGGRLIGSYQGKPVYQLPNGKRVVAR